VFKYADNTSLLVVPEHTSVDSVAEFRHIYVQEWAFVNKLCLNSKKQRLCCVNLGIDLISCHCRLLMICNELHLLNFLVLFLRITLNGKMVNGFRYYRALESVGMIASALSTALTIYPTHARSESINADSLNSNFLQLGRRSGGRPQRAVHPYAVTCQHCDTHYCSRPRTRNLPIVGPTRYQ